MTQKPVTLLISLLNVFIFANNSAGKVIQVVDLSHDVNNDTIYWPNGIPFQLFIQHRGLVDPALEESETNFWYEANEFLTAEHSGTHLDAPVHFARGKWSVDEIPPERFFGPVSVIDLRDRVKDDADYLVSVKDLLHWEAVNKRRLDPLILLWTGWASRWPDRESYLGSSSNNISLLRFPGLDPDAAQWLVDNREVHGVGIDTASIDYGQSKLFQSHRILTKNNVFFIENVNTKELDLSHLSRPSLAVSPLKITTGSGSPVRPLLFSGFPYIDAHAPAAPSGKSDL